MEKIQYNFDPEKAYNSIKEHWTNWARGVGAQRWVIGISGGKDSTVVAALAAKIFGADKVIGVMMPNLVQADMKDSLEICNFLHIPRVIANIGKAYEEMLDVVTYDALMPLGICKASADTKINMPARLRMTMLYAIAQSVGGIVLNTSNLSENMVSYSTLYGDHAGSYGPIQGLTVTEIMQLGDWMGLPYSLVHKTPVDGLQPSSDEERLGFTYAELDRYIRFNEGSNEFKRKVIGMFKKGKFKLEMVRIPGHDFYELANHVVWGSNEEIGE